MAALSPNALAPVVVVTCAPVLLVVVVIRSPPRLGDAAQYDGSTIVRGQRAVTWVIAHGFVVEAICEVAPPPLPLSEVWGSTSQRRRPDFLDLHLLLSDPHRGRC